MPATSTCASERNAKLQATASLSRKTKSQREENGGKPEKNPKTKKSQRREPATEEEQETAQPRSGEFGLSRSHNTF